MRPAIPTNTFCAVEARRLGSYSRRVRNMSQYQNRLVANLIASPSWIFAPVMKKRTGGTAEFACPGMLFMDHNRQCYTLRGPKCKPALLYKLPHRRRPDRHPCLAITRVGMADPNPPPCDMLLILTDTNEVEVRSLHTGKMIKVIDLSSPDSPTCRYQSMSWDIGQNQVIITSTRLDNSSDRRTPIVCYIVILAICPEVKKILRVPISRDVFGRSLCKAVLNDGVLHTVHSGRSELRIYDFDKIRTMNSVRAGAVDPVLDIMVLPEPLLRIPDTDDRCSFGGVPWHYVAPLPGSDSASVRTLDHRELAHFEQTDDTEMDSVGFHLEDSRIISRSSSDMIRYYRVEHAETPGEPDEVDSVSIRPVREFRLAAASDPPSTSRRHSGLSSGTAAHVGPAESEPSREGWPTTRSRAQTQPRRLTSRDTQRGGNGVSGGGGNGVSGGGGGGEAGDDFEVINPRTVKVRPVRLAAEPGANPAGDVGGDGGSDIAAELAFAGQSANNDAPAAAASTSRRDNRTPASSGNISNRGDGNENSNNVSSRSSSLRWPRPVWRSSPADDDVVVGASSETETAAADTASPSGAYALGRSPRMHHLARMAHLPFYYYRAAEAERVLYSDDFENELNIMLLLGCEPGDPLKRGLLQMFDDNSGRRLRSMRFNNTLGPNITYMVTLDLDVLVVSTRAEGSRTSETTVYRLVNLDSLPDNEREHLGLSGFKRCLDPLRNVPVYEIARPLVRPWWDARDPDYVETR